MTEQGTYYVGCFYLTLKCYTYYILTFLYKYLYDVEYLLGELFEGTQLYNPPVSQK